MDEESSYLKQGEGCSLGGVQNGYYPKYVLAFLTSNK